MTVSSADKALHNAREYKTCIPGRCLAYTRTWLEIGSMYGTASVAWANATGKHPGDRSVPKGAPVFWTGGSLGYGHIALVVSPGDTPSIRSTDVTSSGVVSEVPLGWFDDHWPGLHYAGWAEGFNGVTIPYLKDGGGGGGGSDSKWDHGDVYVNKLHKGQQDSDSVGRLCYRLRHHSKMKSSHKPPNQVVNYTDEIVEASRFWQRNIAPKVKGPSDGTSWSNQQANKIFGDNYTVHEK